MDNLKSKSRPHPTTLRDRSDRTPRTPRTPIDVPPELHKQIKAIADINHRTLIGQLSYWANHDPSATLP